MEALVLGLLVVLSGVTWAFIALVDALEKKR
jgi:hypothetical protein